MHRCLASAIAIALLAPAPAAARPRPLAQAAKRELDRGLALFEARNYAAAIGAFDAGYTIDPHPDFLYAKAQAQRIGGDCRGAIVSYEAFLATRPPEKEATRARTNMERCTEVLAASAPRFEPPPAAEPEPEPEPPPRPLSSIPPRIPAGEHDTGRAWWKDRPGLVLAGAGVAALATGATFAWLARSRAGAVAGAEDVTAWYAIEAAYRRDRAAAGIATGVGAALIVTAGIRFVWARRTGDRTVTATATATSGGAALWLGGSW